METAVLGTWIAQRAKRGAPCAATLWTQRGIQQAGRRGGPQRTLLAKILGLGWAVPPDLGVFIWAGFSTPLQPEKQVSPALGPLGGLAF